MHSVFLGGSNITAQCKGEITVTRNERVAGLSRLTYQPTGAPGLPAAMIGKTLTISWDSTRIFTGWVNSATWDPKARSYAVDGSDLLQDFFEALDQAGILAAIPGSRYSKNIHGEREDGWQMALDAIATTTLDVHKDRNGVLQTPSLEAKATPGISLTAADILNNGEYQLDLAKARDLITQQKIKYEYRVSRWKQRRHVFSWDMTNAPILRNGGWCEWYRSLTFLVPLRETVNAAAEGTGWYIDAPIYFESHPESFAPDDGVCGGGSGWGTTDEALEMYVIAAAWDGLMTWAQTVTETYEITLDVLDAQSTYGVIVHEDSAAFSVEADDAGLESTAPPDASGWPQDPINDRYQDQESEADRDNDIQTLMAMGVSRIWDHLRANTVSVRGLINPTAELAHTVGINTGAVQAKGKLRGLEHRITDSAATTLYRVAIIQGGGGEIEDPLDTPARPDTSPSYGAPSGITYIPTRVGWHETESPDYDPAWENESGFVTNLQVPWGFPAPEKYYDPMAFRAKGPDIEDEAREEVTGLSQTVYRVSVPQDTLVLA